MQIIPSRIRTDSPEFKANQQRMTALVAELRDRLARAREGGGTRYLERHREQGKLPVRERIELLLDEGSPFLELSALAAWEMYDNEAPGASLVTGVGRVSGREVLIVANDATAKGGNVLSDDGQETPPRAADCIREPAAVRLPRRLRRRLPSASSGRISRQGAFRPHLLQPGADVG
jgi:hypothetical protein